MVELPNVSSLALPGRVAPIMADVAAGAWLLADWGTVILLVVVLALLGIAFGVGQVLKRRPDTSVNPALVQMFNRRIAFWWIMCAILMAALFRREGAILLFFLISFWALREFITLTPTRLGDHRALFWVFFVFTPLQYLLVYLGPQLHGLYSILIPVYAFLFVPARVALAGDCKRFLERTAKIQVALMLCVYSLSFAPALLDLDLKTYDQNAGVWVPWEGSTAGLLFYFFLLAQLSDVLQYVWSKLLGKNMIAPAINASRTWEGVFGGVASTTLLGTLLWWVTPFSMWQSACMAAVIAVLGFAGSMTMSAIKRDRGVEDYGTLVEGHAGVLDRLDAICFASPIFFHLTRYYFMVRPDNILLPPPGS